MKLTLLFALGLLMGSMFTLVSCAADQDDAPSKTAESPHIPVDGKDLTDALAKAGRPVLSGEPVDWDTFAEPVESAGVSVGGYPIYLISCDPAVNTCAGPGGKELGPMTAVVDRLTPIRNKDVVSGLYHCPSYCIDQAGRIVGKVSSAMRLYLKDNPQQAIPAHASTATVRSNP